MANDIPPCADLAHQQGCDDYRITMTGRVNLVARPIRRPETIPNGALGGKTAKSNLLTTRTGVTETYTVLEALINVKGDCNG